MISVINAFSEFPSFLQIANINGVRAQIKLTFRARTNSWYFDLYEEDGTPIVLGKRLSVGWDPTYGLASIGPDLKGLFYVKGNDDYDRFDLGQNLSLWFIPTEDLYTIAPVETDEDAPVVVIV